MFGCWFNVYVTLLMSSHVLAGSRHEQSEGESYSGVDSSGRQGRPIPVVGGTQATGDARVGTDSGRPGTPGLAPGGRGNAGDGTPGRFAPGVGTAAGGASPGVGGRLGGSTGPVVGGGAVGGGRFGPGGLLGPGAALGAGRFGGSSGQGTRIVEAPGIPTLTRTVTVDRFVTLTDTAYHTIPVTLTDFTVRTKTLPRTQVARTPVDDRVAIRTQVVFRPRTLTVTYTKSYFRIETEVPVTTVTVTHSSYIIKQATYTMTATEVLTLTSTRVQTVVNTQRRDRTVYHTVTNTVVAPVYYY